MKYLLTLALAGLLGACGAEWRTLDPLDPHLDPELEGSPRLAPELHGHRDFARPFEQVWMATVEALHASGVAVPQSAIDAAAISGSEVLLELDPLRLQVVERDPGRTCVRVHLRGVAVEEGRREAQALLDDLQWRLNFGR